SASASSRAVSLRPVRLIPRSRSLTDRGLTPAPSASSSCVSRAPARSRRSRPAKLSAGSAATSYLSAVRRSPVTGRPAAIPVKTIERAGGGASDRRPAAVAGKDRAVDVGRVAGEQEGDG